MLWGNWCLSIYGGRRHTRNTPLTFRRLGRRPATFYLCFILLRPEPHSSVHLLQYNFIRLIIFELLITVIRHTTHRLLGCPSVAQPSNARCLFIATHDAHRIVVAFAHGTPFLNFSAQTAVPSLDCGRSRSRRQTRTLASARVANTSVYSTRSGHERLILWRRIIN